LISILSLFDAFKFADVYDDKRMAFRANSPSFANRNGKYFLDGNKHMHYYA